MSNLSIYRHLLPVLHRIEEIERRKPNLCQRIWTSVSDFFKWIASKIAAGFAYLSAGVKRVCCPLQTNRTSVQTPTRARSASVPDTPEVVEAVRQKLALYRDMPFSKEEFLAESITIMRTLLDIEDEKIDEALKQELGVEKGELSDLDLPPEKRPQHLKTFDEEAQAFMPSFFAKAALAFMRAFVFHENLGGYNVNALNSVFNAQQHEVKNQLVRARETFKNLNKTEQLFILNKMNVGEVNALELSEEAKEVLRAIDGAVSALSFAQRNAPFLRDLQQLVPKIYAAR